MRGGVEKRPLANEVLSIWSCVSSVWQQRFKSAGSKHDRPRRWRSGHYLPHGKRVETPRNKMVVQRTSMPTGHPDLRPGILDLLDLLSSEDRQHEYQKSVPQVSVPTELVSMWFDDCYHPETEAFRRCFSEQELIALAIFNDYYDSQLELLSLGSSQIGEWLSDDAWRDLMRKAAETLLELRKQRSQPSGS